MGNRMKQMSDTERLQRLKEPIIEKCKGEKRECSKIEIIKDTFVTTNSEGTSETTLFKKFCSVYAFPKAKWRNGDCNMADHIEIEAAKKEKIRVGQQKQKQKKK